MNVLSNKIEDPRKCLTDQSTNFYFFLPSGVNDGEDDVDYDYRNTFRIQPEAKNNRDKESLPLYHHNHHLFW